MRIALTPTSLSIFGTSGRDYLSVSYPIDVFASLFGGDDTSLTDGGADSIDAGAGNDWIDTGEGNDSVIGGDGDDVIIGRGGSDFIDSGVGANVVIAGEGADVVIDTGNNSFVHGGGDNDYLLHYSGGEAESSATLMGAEGNDFIYGGGGNDSLNGGDGRDYLIGSGEDVMRGGDEADQFSFTNNHTQLNVDVLDFNPAEGDRLDVSGGVGVWDYSQSGAYFDAPEAGNVILSEDGMFVLHRGKVAVFEGVGEEIAQMGGVEAAVAAGALYLGEDFSYVYGPLMF